MGGILLGDYSNRVTTAAVNKTLCANSKYNCSTVTQSAAMHVLLACVDMNFVTPN